MPVIKFINPQGEITEVEAKTGHSVMEVAVDNNIGGMLAECGGACACATCHTYIGEAWLNKLAPVDDMEDAMLESALDRQPNSRLSCQIEVTDELDGLEVTVADNG